MSEIAALFDPANDRFWVNLLILIVFLVFAILPFWRLWKRAGHSPLWSLFAVVPIANVVMLWVLALKRWPADRERRF